MKRISALLLAALFCISGCGSISGEMQIPPTVDSTSAAKTEATDAPTESAAAASTPAATTKTTSVTTALPDIAEPAEEPMSQWDSYVYFRQADLKTETTKTKQRVADLFFEIIDGEILPFSPIEEHKWIYIMSDDTEFYSIEKCRTNAGWCYSFCNMLFPINEEFDKYIEEQGTGYVKLYSNAFDKSAHTVLPCEGGDGLIGFSRELNYTPVTSMDFCRAAFNTVEKWALDNGIRGWEFRELFSLEESSCPYMAEINGRLYFAVYIRRWVLCSIKDNVCTVKYCSENGRTQDYKWIGSCGSECFYDLMSDAELMSALEAQAPVFSSEELSELYEEEGSVCNCQGVVPLPEDKVYNVYVITGSRNESHIRIYNGTNWRGRLSYTDSDFKNTEFPMYFDDYNGDGMPEFALKHRTERGGTYYKIYSMEYCHSENFRYWNDTVFVPQTALNAPRLQMCGVGLVVSAISPEDTVLGGYDFDKKQHFDVPVSDFNMYSQRYYLPGAMRAYPCGTKEIIFNLWNNTDSPAFVGGEYTVQRLDNGEWVDEDISGQLEQRRISCGHWTEYAVDISRIVPPNGRITEYRLKLTSGENTIYGGFYLGEENERAFEISEGTQRLAKNGTQMSFTVTNTGSETLVIDTAKLYKDDKFCQEIGLHNSERVIGSGESAEIFLVAAENCDFGESRYTIELVSGDVTESFTLEPSGEPAKSFAEQFPMQITECDGNYIVTVKNLNQDKKTLTNFFAITASVFSDRKSKQCYAVEFNGSIYLGDDPYYVWLDGIDFDYGESISVKVITDINSLSDEDCSRLYRRSIGSWEEIPDSRQLLSESDYYAKPKSGDVLVLDMSWIDENDQFHTAQQMAVIE